VGLGLAGRVDIITTSFRSRAHSSDIEPAELISLNEDFMAISIKERE
jgi:hypothetical protein